MVAKGIEMTKDSKLNETKAHKDMKMLNVALLKQHVEGVGGAASPIA